jgi:AraC-like DNA-binding protein/quercetin dioxygenase-like cupin family protein
MLVVRHIMVVMRQGVLTEYDPKPGVSIATLAYEYPARFSVTEHSHRSDQLVYAVRGVMEVSAGQSFWLVPPHCAVWIPAGEKHRIRMPGAVSMRSLYVQPRLAAGRQKLCKVIHVGPLLRELIVEAVKIGNLRATNRLHRALRDLIVEQLRSASAVPTLVTLPQDRRALAIAHILLSDASDRQTVPGLCAVAGASVRTIERVFKRETGMSLEIWRRQVRLMKAIELLIGGDSVKEAAFKIGCQQPGTFVKSFRETFGVTPKAWIRGLAKGDWSRYRTRPTDGSAPSAPAPRRDGERRFP